MEFMYFSLVFISSDIILVVAITNNYKFTITLAMTILF